MVDNPIIDEIITNRINTLKYKRKLSDEESIELHNCVSSDLSIYKKLGYFAGKKFYDKIGKDINCNNNKYNKITIKDIKRLINKLEIDSRTRIIRNEFDLCHYYEIIQDEEELKLLHKKYTNRIIDPINIAAVIDEKKNEYIDGYYEGAIEAIKNRMRMNF
jgi:hypothetical protein